MTTGHPLYYFLSLVTTGLCLVLKLPQIKTVIKNKSVAGLSKSSLMLEFWSYLTTVSYSVYFDYPFGLYSEYPSLLFQDVILMVLILIYENDRNQALCTFVPTALLIHATIALKLTPSWLPVLALHISSPVGILSKAIQLYEILSKKDAGQVSALSWFLNSISSLARLLSFFLSIPDTTLVISLTFSTMLNVMVAVAARTYRSPSKAKAQ